MTAHLKLPHAGFCANLAAAAVMWARLQLLGGILYLIFTQDSQNCCDGIIFGDLLPLL